MILKLLLTKKCNALKDCCGNCTLYSLFYDIDDDNSSEGVVNILLSFRETFFRINVCVITAAHIALFEGKRRHKNNIIFHVKTMHKSTAD